MEAELVFNLWAIYDASSGTVYGLSGKAYNLSGTDRQKLEFLKVASRTDYVTAKRYRVPDRFSITFSDAVSQRGVTYINAVYDPSAQLFKEVFQNIEADLPLLSDFSGGDIVHVNQTIPEDPLCVTTVLYHDEVGDIHPIVTDEDREWFAKNLAMGFGQ